MTIPKWLLPVLAGIAVLAVGTASAIMAFVLLGGGASSPDSAADAPSEAATEVVPLIAPVGYGDEPPPVDLDGDPDTDDVSPYLGSETVPASTAGEPPAIAEGSDGVIIGSDPASIADLIAPETLALIDTLAVAEDPTAVPAIVPLVDGGDPCALPDAPSESCPDGLRSRILSSTALPPLFMWATTSPVIADSPPLTSLACDPVELAEGEARFAVGTNLPATVTITYWPMGNRADARTLSLDTPESQVALFEADPPRDGAPFTVLKHCVVLDELELATRYQVEVVAETEAGERRERTHYLALGVDLTRPPARIIPIGLNVVLASAAHRDGETVLLRAGLLSPDSSTDCADIDTLPQLELVSGTSTARVTLASLERNGYLPEFTQRTGGGFFIPEGRNALICLTSYDDDRPSWNWQVADFTTSTIVQSPDVAVPRVTWSGASVRDRSGVSELYVSLAARGTPECGERGITVPVYDNWFTTEPDRGIVLCERFALDGYNFVNTGTFVVRVATRVDGEYKTTSLGLPLGRDRCIGVCEALPPTSHYSIALPIVEVPSGLCGSSFGECDPPTSAVSAGTVQLRVDWEHGARNGAETWNVGPIVEAAGVPPVFDVPQFDTAAFPRFVEDVSGTRLEFELRSDRPVDYRATLSGDCLLPDTVTVVEGRFESTPERVSFANPCRGATYRVEIELIDDAGRSAQYGPLSPDGIWANAVSTPGTPLRVNVSYRLTALTDDGRELSYVGPIRVVVGATPFFGDFWTRNSCFEDAYASDLATSAGAEYPDIIPIVASITMRNGFGPGEPRYYEGRPQCDREATGGDTITVETSMTLRELRSAGSATFTAENDRLRLLLTVTVLDGRT